MGSDPPVKSPSIDATIQDGHTIATAKVQIICPITGDYSLNFTLTNLRRVDQVLEIRRHTNPLTNSGTPSWWNIQGNLVGVSLIDVGAGTTLTAWCTALGI